MDRSDCAIVTGGASGIGKSIVNCLVRRGVRVVFADLAASSGSEFEAELNRSGEKARFFACDITVEKQLRGLFQFTKEVFGGANIVINNAGIARDQDIEKSLEFIDDLIQVNLIAVVKGTSLAIQHFNEQKAEDKFQGRDFNIITMGSILGLRPQFPGAVYSLSKAAVISFSQNMKCLIEKGIRVNCIAPCFIATNLFKQLDPPSINAFIESCGGFMDVSHVDTAVCHFLDNKHLSGEVYEIDPSHIGLVTKA